jgi:outer membrane protein TolC
MRYQTAFAAIVILAGGAGVVTGQTPAPVAPLSLAQPSEATGPPATITLQDALQRASQNDALFQVAAADARSATEDRVQARAGLLPSFSFSTQYIGNQANGVNPNGRFVSMDGVNMYRAWGVVRQEISPRRKPPHGSRSPGADSLSR